MIRDSYANLSTLVAHQLAVYPEHRRYLERRFSGTNADDQALADELSGHVLRIAGDNIDTACEDYKTLVGWNLEEELHFRRTGAYRLSTFADAYEQYYSKPDVMTQYMNGQLLTQVWWRNHTAVYGYFRDTFLPGNRNRFRHLEVGPGHGLTLYLAAAAPNCASAEGWDISPASLAMTRQALERVGSRQKIELLEVAINNAPKREFDSIVFSEVLEHLEDPLTALRNLYALLARDGRLFINAPANAPMPDHVYLFHSPEEIVDMMKQAGFEIVDAMFAPPTGATLEQARKKQLSISAAVIGVRR